MLVGYARTSTADQKAGLEAQVAELKGAGVEELFVEQISSVRKQDELDKALKFMRKGDELVVTKLDQLARWLCHVAVEPEARRLDRARHPL